ncbi:L-threonylcarbamoyladenylate synthase [Alkalihalobacillus xiaoxiensis]|uniref:Threonylcarbamoyl-AMP synthase n=2 Tax=Shouchella xiaoxiensis TaxID=766895 RepID=A0ABS2SYM5_9BACI|nr:L-threonylcarbamoyladenylate synthase [Shouchella xiaoxiensis]
MMSYKQTKTWVVDSGEESEEQILDLQEAGMWIRDGKLVAFPTETVYGLGANAFSEEAVQRIFEAKGRPSDNPLIVHISDEEQLDGLVTEVSNKAKALMEAFWPGALTLIFNAKPVVAKNVTAGLNTVGVRIPSHPVARQLLREGQLPVAAPSANRSGRPSPTTAAHVLLDLDGRIDGIVDGGETGIGLESTVLSVVHDPPILYRPGGVTVEQIEAIIGAIKVDPSLQQSVAQPLSPGMKYAHYAPKATVVLVEHREELERAVVEAKNHGKKVGVFATVSKSVSYADEVIVANGLEEVAHMLYGTLREFDKRNVSTVFIESVPKEGLGLAIMNRLEKAAGSKK